MPSRFITVTLTGAALALGGLATVPAKVFSASPAIAETSSRSTSSAGPHVVSSDAMPKPVTKNRPQSSTVTPMLSGCTISAGNQGAYICEYGWTKYQWPDGRQETFITGTDHTVYHAWQTSPGGNWTNWAAFPNTYARSGVFLTGNDWSQPTIGVIGTDNQPWCDTYSQGSGSWSGFHHCS
jgi:hypothetical protein